MRNSKKAKGGGQVSSFFIFEFPDRIKAGHLLKNFGCMGDVVEVVIPPKKNKFGKRFGFARFNQVWDERIFAVKLDNVMIDNRKIHANLPRFVRKVEGSTYQGA